MFRPEQTSFLEGFPHILIGKNPPGHNPLLFVKQRSSQRLL